MLANTVLRVYTSRAGVFYLPAPSSCQHSPWHCGWVMCHVPQWYQGAWFGPRAGSSRLCAATAHGRSKNITTTWRQVLAVQGCGTCSLTLGSMNSIWPLVFNTGLLVVAEDAAVMSCVIFSAPFAIVQYIRYLWSIFFFLV